MTHDYSAKQLKMYMRIVIAILFATSTSWATTPNIGLVTTIQNAGRCEWNPVNANQIACDDNSVTGTYEVYLMAPDGSGKTCLTCSPPAACTGGDTLPSTNKGSPAWSADGKILTLIVLDPASGEGSSPGSGFDMNPWAITFTAGGAMACAKKIADYTTGNLGNSGTLHPHFNHQTVASANAKLAFTHARSQAGLGTWDMRVWTSVSIDGNNVPQIGTSNTFLPTAGKFYEVTGWNPADTELLVTANLNSTHQYCMDLTRINASTGAVVAIITGGSCMWNEISSYNPTGDLIFACRSWGYTNDGAAAHIPPKLELGILTPTGGNSVRLTGYNDPLSPDYALTSTIGKYGCGEVSFSPAGDRVSVQSNFFGPLGANLGTITRVYSVSYYSYSMNGVYRAAGKGSIQP